MLGVAEIDTTGLPRIALEPPYRALEIRDFIRSFPLTLSLDLNFKLSYRVSLRLKNVVDVANLFGALLRRAFSVSHRSLSAFFEVLDLLGAP